MSRHDIAGEAPVIARELEFLCTLHSWGARQMRRTVRLNGSTQRQPLRGTGSKRVDSSYVLLRS